MLYITMITAATIFLFGIVVGSFLNVCIYRIPNKEDMISKRSHCMACGNVLEWYELIPIVSFLLQRGKCRNCHEKLSVQYPMVELGNGLLWGMLYLIYGFNLNCVLYMLCVSALIVISCIDIKTYEIPIGLNVFIFVLGVIGTVGNLAHWEEYVIGFFAVSGFFMILYIATKGRAMGGGDIKLMAAAGLLLGWKKILLAMVIGCVVGAVFHSLLMKIRQKDRQLAFGPYLSIGIISAMLCGEQMISWYVNMFFR